MYKFKNLMSNPNLNVVEKVEGMRVIEYARDLSVTPSTAITAYFANEMNVRKRQLFIELKDNAYTLSAGTMQWTAGDVTVESGIKGVGDFLGKAMKGVVTKESVVKPVYKGNGVIMLEPTYKHILLEDISTWKGGIVLDDGLFLACEDRVKQCVTMRSNLSSAVLGNEGFFNLSLAGNGVAVLESNVPEDELIEINLNNGELKIDGRQAVCWSTSLDFTVEKSTKSLIGSAISNEGFLNVYRGTGKVLMSPVAPTDSLAAATNTVSAKAADTASNVANAANIIGSFLGK